MFVSLIFKFRMDSDFPEGRKSFRRKCTSVSVGFCPSSTVFFYAEDGGESCTMSKSHQRITQTKLFDGRSEAMRSALEIDQIEEFLTRSSCVSEVHGDWLFPRRSRSYAHHWDDLSALVTERDNSDTNSSSSYDACDSMWLMENLPCDADLTPTNLLDIQCIS